MKLNQVLALTENQQTELKKILTDYIGYFKNSQGDFKGEKKTYEAIPGYVDMPANRYNKLVVTTVNEKLDYLFDVIRPILKNQFDLEGTNAAGLPKAELVIAGESWGEFTSLELLRLKSFVTNPKLIEMIQRIPVKSDSREWRQTEEEGYQEREIQQTPTLLFQEKTTEKEEVILHDPNIQKAIEAGKEINYSPQTSVKSKQVVIGEGTFTEFSGEWSHHARAHALKRIQQMKEAIIDALQRANQVEVVESKLDPEKVLSFIFG